MQHAAETVLGQPAAEKWDAFNAMDEPREAGPDTCKRANRQTVYESCAICQGSGQVAGPQSAGQSREADAGEGGRGLSSSRVNVRSCVCRAVRWPFLPWPRMGFLRLPSTLAFLAFRHMHKCLSELCLGVSLKVLESGLLSISQRRRHPQHEAGKISLFALTVFRP